MPEEPPQGVLVRWRLRGRIILTRRVAPDDPVAVLFTCAAAAGYAASRLMTAGLVLQPGDPQTFRQAGLTTPFVVELVPRH